MDIPAVSKFAHESGARVGVDNVFATALKQRPLENGADIVIYLTNKHIDGQGRLPTGLEDTDNLIEDSDQAAACLDTS